MQHHYLGCMECRYCETGWTQLCPVTDKRLYYGGSAHGGHGEYMVADARTCVPLSNDLTFDAGAYLACGATTAYQALKTTERFRPRRTGHISAPGLLGSRRRCSVRPWARRWWQSTWPVNG